MSSVTFDDSFINRVYIDPDTTLASYDSIWKEDVFKLVYDWHKYSGAPLDHTTIKAHLNDLKEKDIEKRRTHPVVKLRDKVMSRAPTFQRSVFPRIASLLPSKTPIEATVNLVALITPGAFCAAGKIIVNLSNTQLLEAGDDLIFNIIAHELYHFGFHSHQEQGFEAPSNATPRQLKDHVLWWLQNEGMATYASYSVTDIYPTHGFARDYIMLDNPTDVHRLITDVNEILTATTELPRDALIDMLWKKGVKERAFYVVGAHMAHTIEREKGRETLISLIKEGSQSYTETYNTLASKEMRVEL